MHIVFFAHFAGSPNHGMVFGHYHLAREWVRMGHQVSIVAASYAHTRYSQPNAFRGTFQEEEIDGIHYVWVKCPSYDPKKKIDRVRNILTYIWRCIVNKLPLSPCDIVVASSHYPFAIWPAKRLSLANNALLITEIRDLWPLTLIELGGASPLNPFILMMQWAENTAYKTSDKVVSVLKNAKSYMVRHGMHPSKFVYIPNGIDTIAPLSNDLPETHAELLINLKKQGLFLVGYAGRMGTANALDNFIKAIANIPDKKVCAVLLGDGYHKEELEKYATRLKISERIFFLPPVKKSEVPTFLEWMDALFIGLKNVPIFRYGVSPNKLNDYLLAAKPIIFAIDTENEAARESGAVFTCQPEDTKDIAEAIQKLRNLSEEERILIGKKGHDWIINNRIYSKLAEQFLDKVQQ